MKGIIRWVAALGILILVLAATAVVWLTHSVGNNLLPPADPEGQQSIASYAIAEPRLELPDSGKRLEHFTLASIVIPPKSARPWTRWWWPGGAVDIETLMNQVEMLDQAYFGGAEVQASAMGIGAVKSEPELEAVNSYDSPAFYTTLNELMDALAAYDWQLDLGCTGRRVENYRQLPDAFR